MNEFVQDFQSVSGTDATVFGVLQTGASSASCVLVNNGVNTINYHFQQFNGTAWVDIQTQGNPLNNTLTAGSSITVLITGNSYSYVRLNANASGGSVILFSLTRYFIRADGADVPILAN